MVQQKILDQILKWSMCIYI